MLGKTTNTSKNLQLKLHNSASKSSPKILIRTCTC